MRKGVAVILAASIVLLGCATTANAATVGLECRDGNVAALQRQVDAPAGRLYPPGMQWVKMATLTSAGVLTHRTFGEAVALSGDTALVGAYGEKGGVGAAYVYVRSGTDWKLQARLTASDGATGDWFGWSVALSGDTALVGAYGGDENQGAAYVFVRSGTDWNQQAKLTATDGVANHDFGWSVALEGDAALVGAPGVTVPDPDYPDFPWIVGSAYVFTRSGAAWSLQAKLIAWTVDPEERDGDGGLGSSVTLSGDTALLGAPGSIGGASWPGAAYVFTRAGSQWEYEAKLAAPDGRLGDGFGDAVAVHGDTAIVGSWSDAIGLNYGQGSAHVFTRSGGVWSYQAKLTASDGDEDDMFGYEIALSGDTALIGALNHEAPDFAPQGSAYVFVRSGGTWSQGADLTSGRAYRCGIAVALSDSTALVGANEPGGAGTLFHGVAYVFNLVQDSAAPTTRAFAATTRKGKRVSLAFRVDDPAPSCGRATVVLRIVKGTKVKKVLRVPGTCACNVKRSYLWKCTLPPGRYALKVFATDLAGHRQSKVGSARLTVR
jgi:FG-GAP repeat